MKPTLHYQPEPVDYKHADGSMDVIVLDTNPLEQMCGMYCASGQVPLCFYDGNTCPVYGRRSACSKDVDV